MRAIGALLGALLIIPQAGSTVQRTPRSETAILEPRGLRSELRRALDVATQAYSSGKFAQAIADFTGIQQRAAEAGLHDLAARAVWGLGNCHLLQSRYDEALAAFHRARIVFERLGDVEGASTMQGSIASLYSQLGEINRALETLERSLDKPGHRLDNYRPGALLLWADLLARQGRLDEALPIFHQGIDAAYQIGHMHQVAFGWNRMGYELLRQGRLDEAERALLEAFRIRKLHRAGWLEGARTALGILRIEQGDLVSAEALLENASLSAASATGVPYWHYYRARARLRWAQGRIDEALADYRRAMDHARTHRALLPAGDELRISFEGSMQNLFSSYLEVGSQRYFSHPGAKMLRELFEAAEENRAASLDARIREDPAWRKRLPPRFAALARELKQAEAAVVRENRREDRRRVTALRDELLRMEAAAGSGVSELNREKTRRDLLRRTQSALSADAAMFSFHLGERGSHLFAVTGNRLAYYRLPSKDQIRLLAERFRAAVRDGDGGSLSREGSKLYRTLFGQAAPVFQKKSRWLLSLDDTLFTVPFSALPAREGGFLIGHREITIVPSAQAVAAAAVRSGATQPWFIQPWFIGVGDAVFNTADERWLRRRGRFPLFRRVPREAGALARLPGSGREIAAAAQVWPTAEILSGADVTEENVTRAAALGPAVLHFATHVVSDPSRDEARIMLSLSGDGESTYITEAEVRACRTSAGLVVLSGCASGSGRTLPGTGLVGLTRAWLMAGAGAVLASYWPVPDDSGEFFGHFYRRLRVQTVFRPAEALRQAQVEMIASGGWRSAPRYWASYFLVGQSGRS